METTNPPLGTLLTKCVKDKGKGKSKSIPLLA
jgi:hypothetical protein